MNQLVKQIIDNHSRKKVSVPAILSHSFTESPTAALEEVRKR